MAVTAGSQIFVFGGSIVCGAALGFVFDLFRIHRKFFNVKTAFLAVSDILFWLVAALIFAQFILVANSGMIRIFELIGVLIGSVLYFKFISIVATNLSVWLIRMFNKIAVFVIKIIVVPCIFTYKIFHRPCMFIAFKLSENRKKFVRFAKRI